MRTTRLLIAVLLTAFLISPARAASADESAPTVEPATAATPQPEPADESAPDPEPVHTEEPPPVTKANGTAKASPHPVVRTAAADSAPLDDAQIVTRNDEYTVVAATP